MNMKESICPVPKDQRPINEYLELKETLGFSWTIKSKLDYYKNSIQICFITLILLIYFVSNANLSLFNTLEYSIFWWSFILFLFYIRIYLGWNYIYRRLMQSTVAYEESGWYDGQIWVKPPEVLIQDKLAGQYEVKPVLNEIKNILRFFSFLMVSSLYCLVYIK